MSYEDENGGSGSYFPMELSYSDMDFYNELSVVQIDVTFDDIQRVVIPGHGEPTLTLTPSI